MLKDITLGQYFPGDTLIHRLDPRTKLLCVILYIVALFNAKSVLTYAIVAVVLTVCILISKVHYKALTRGLKPVYIIVAFTAIMNLFFSGGTPVADVWLLRHITYEGIRSAIAMVLRIIMLIMGTFLLTYTTSPISLTDALEHLLSPLKKLKMPIHELSMMMSIALRFIPTLIEETDKIMSAQKARGADFESGNIFQRAKALVPILVPLFISAFRRADELATAMECRCYHGGEGRTALHVLRYKAADYLALTVFLADDHGSGLDGYGGEDAVIPGGLDGSHDGGEVGLALLELQNGGLTAQALHFLLEVVTEAGGVVVTGLDNQCAVDAALFLVGEVGHHGALEGINVGNAEIVVVTLGHLRIGARGADGGDLSIPEQGAGGNGAAGAVGADDHGHALGDQGLSRSGSLGLLGSVVGGDELNLVLLAVNGDGGLDGVGILDAQNLLLAAGAVLAGGGLKNTDLHGVAAVRAAAGNQRHGHNQGQQQCNDFFHLFFLLICFSHKLSKNHL